MVEAPQFQAVALFHYLAPQRLRQLLAGSKIQRYQKGEVLFRQGDLAESIWIVLDGWVHLVRSPRRDDATHAVVLFTVTPREALCGVSGVEPGTYTAGGIAGTTSHVVRIPATLFHEVLTEEPQFAVQVLHLFALRIRQMAEQYGMMAEPVSHRIVRSMLRLREQFGATLPVTHRELAQMSWTTTESAIRTVRHLKQQGFVRGARGQLTIQRVKALRHLLRHPNGHHALQR